MTLATPFEIFLVTPPGLETLLADEARDAGFAVTATQPGGVILNGTWADVWRANLALRGATRVLARIGAFRALHLAQLDKRARRFPWGGFLRADVPVRVETTCRKSRIYHAGAATQRIERALTKEHGLVLSPDARLVIKARIEDDLCTLSLDTSGAALHRRGHKRFVGKAPLREGMAAMFLRRMGFDGRQCVVDPMCGSGTIPIEAAEIAAGLLPGRSRSFAFQDLAAFDAPRFDAMKRTRPRPVAARFIGSDRDGGAIGGAAENAARAGVADLCAFARGAVSDLVPPEGPPGIVLTNPPYGARIGNRKPLFGLYGSLGRTLAARFGGWRIGIVTSDGGLARATGLPLSPAGPPVAHGGLKITLYQTPPLA